jgi:hypothetical protein
VVARRAHAAGERHITLRPAPEAMARLSGLLPVAQGVAVIATLDPHARSLIAGEDARAHGQIMPTPWSSGSPGKPPPPTCRWRSGW